MNYYQIYFHNLTSVLESLHNQLRKNIKWRWGQKGRNSFEKFKELLCSPKLLVHYSNSLPLIIGCDSSPFTIGTFLSHKYPDNFFTIITDHKPLLGILLENKSIPIIVALRIQKLAIIWKRK